MPYSYEFGAACWVDHVSPDPAVSTAFYTGLFGWRAVRGPHMTDRAHTTLTLADGRPVAALMAHLPQAPSGTRAVWTTYFTVSDLEASAKSIADANGRVFLGPTDIGELGTFSMLFDPMGAHVGLWQPKEFAGAAVINEPGTYCGSELRVRDTTAAKAFYETVFGWNGETRPFGPTTYTDWHVPGGPAIGGMLRMDEMWPAETRAHWMVYFAVADCDATAARAVELGGAVQVPPIDTARGRFAVLNDAQGAYFSIVTLNA
jgi:predicted enzyme related to lactoylglutathione lyase